MPRKHAQRVTNGQRAAVCGLVIAGIAYTKACMIAGVPYRGLKATLPPDWHEWREGRRRWKPHMLAELYEAWMDPNQKVETIATRYDLTFRAITQIAFREKWPRRRWGTKRPTALRSMSKEQRRWYLKMQPVLGRDAALAEVWGR